MHSSVSIQYIGMPKVNKTTLQNDKNIKYDENEYTISSPQFDLNWIRHLPVNE